jgi:putative Mn2+ efflux pump MntP
MLNFCGIVTAILKMATGSKFSMSGINSGHHYLLTYQILMISTMLNFCGIVVAILKMSTGRNFQWRESIRDIIIYAHIKF